MLRDYDPEFLLHVTRDELMAIEYRRRVHLHAHCQYRARISKSAAKRKRWEELAWRWLRSAPFSFV